MADYGRDAGDVAAPQRPRVADHPDHPETEHQVDGGFHDQDAQPEVGDGPDRFRPVATGTSGHQQQPEYARHDGDLVRAAHRDSGTPPGSQRGQRDRPAEDRLHRKDGQVAEGHHRGHQAETVHDEADEIARLNGEGTPVPDVGGRVGLKQPGDSVSTVATSADIRPISMDPPSRTPEHHSYRAARRAELTELKVNATR